MDQRAGQAELLFHAAGELAGLEARKRLMPEPRAAGPRARAGRGRAFEQIGVEADVFVDGQVFVETEPLRHVAHMLLGALGIGDDIDAVDDDAPPSGRMTPASMRMVVGLAGAVGTDEAEDFAAVDRKAEASTAVTSAKRLVSPSTAMMGACRGHGLPGGSASRSRSAGMPGTSSWVGLSMSIRMR